MQGEQLWQATSSIAAGWELMQFPPGADAH